MRHASPRQKLISRLFVALILTLLVSNTLFQNTGSASREKFALVIGIKGYPKFPAHEKLRHADRDAESFVQFIKTPEGGAFPENNIRLLRNEEATKENISRAVEWLSRRVKSDDLVYIFFSGHGIVDRLGYAYFMPHDSDPAYPDVLGIRADVLLQNLKARINSKHTIYFIDACHSGAALVESGVAKDIGATTSSVISEIWEKELAQRDSISMAFLSAGGNQRSWEDDELQQGVFTYYLLEGMKGAADKDSNNVITAGEVYRYVLDRVEERTRLKKYPLQTPIISPLFDHSFPLGVVNSPRRLRPVEPKTAGTTTTRQRIISRGIPEAVQKVLTEAAHVNYVLFTTAQAWVVITGRNGQTRFDLPKSLTDALDELNKAGSEISRIALFGKERWVIIQGRNGFRTYGVSAAMSQTLKEINSKNGVILDVAFSPNGGWIILSDKSVSWTTDLPQDLRNALKETNDESRVAFAPGGGWVLITGANGYKTSNVPQDIINILSDVNEKGETIQQVVFSPNGGWIVITTSRAPR